MPAGIDNLSTMHTIIPDMTTDPKMISSALQLYDFNPLFGLFPVADILTIGFYYILPVFFIGKLLRPLFGQINTYSSLVVVLKAKNRLFYGK